jgi:hypothetical protein
MIDEHLFFLFSFLSFPMFCSYHTLFPLHSGGDIIGRLKTGFPITDPFLAFFYDTYIGTRVFS